MSISEDQTSLEGKEIGQPAKKATVTDHEEKLDASLKRALDIFRKYIWCIE